MLGSVIGLIMVDNTYYLLWKTGKKFPGGFRIYHSIRRDFSLSGVQLVRQEFRIR